MQREEEGGEREGEGILDLHVGGQVFSTVS